MLSYNDMRQRQDCEWGCKTLRAWRDKQWRELCREANQTMRRAGTWLQVNRGIDERVPNGEDKSSPCIANVPK
jgi:hypothetical protein